MEKITYKSVAGMFALSLVSSSCISAGEGVDASADKIYFPVSLIRTEADTLLVVNSDFDLQYSQGTVQSLSLPRLREVSQKPCNSDTDCTSGTICDTKSNEYNAGSASFVCVDPSDPAPCGPFGEKSTSERAVSPGRCGPVDLDKPADGGELLIVDVAKTAAFATQGLLLARPCTDGAEGSRACTEDDGADLRIEARDGANFPERLFIPVRGDTTIHYLDVDEQGKFSCGRPMESTDKTFLTASDEELRCDSSLHRISWGKTFGLDEEGNFVEGNEPPLPGDLDSGEIKDIEDDPANEFRLQPEPIDLAASEEGRFLLVSHQVQGMVSALMNNWLDPPALIFVLRDLPDNPLGIAALPGSPVDASLVTHEAQWNYLLSYRTEARIDLLHLDDDGLLKGAASAPSNEGDEAVSLFRPLVTRVDSTAVTTNEPGTHSRGLVVDDRKQRAEIAACEGDAACEAEAAESPLNVYVTNRTPSSLLVGQTGGESRLAQASLLPRFYDTIPLSAGPSRVVLGHVVGQSGELEPRVFVICFDAALIFVFDPERRVVESEIRTGRGPYSLAFDYEAGVIYVGHFTDSYIGVISIDQRFPFTYGATLATVGTPKGPRASK